MKLVKSLLLGSAAGLAAVVGAQAADLPVRKAAPVEYVRVCSTYGAGFFYIPGTETCLRVGGRVRAEMLFAEPNDREDDSIGFRARGRLNIDARTATAYGLLRTYIRYELERNTGVAGTSTGGLDQAFVQFGGLTAGKALSFFYNPDITNPNMGTLRFYDFVERNLFAYTFAFGNGFSATLSLEEGEFGGQYIDPVLLGSGSALAAGQRAPDVVANLKYSGTWGSAQLSGAVHQVRSNVLDLATYGPVLAGTIPDTEYGFAVGFQGTVNLPMLAPGDTLWLAAAYADGALGFLGTGSSVTVGTARGEVIDAYIDADGDIATGEGWSIAGGINHFWTPQIRQGVFGSYMNIEYGRDLAALTGVDYDFTEWRVGTNLVYRPVAGLDLGLEVLYARVDTEQPYLVNGSLRDHDDAWEGRIRVQRDF